MFNQDLFISQLKDLIKIPSKRSSAKVGMPFGKDVAHALNYFLDLALSMGFTVKNYDNYIGEITLGDGKEELGIIGHLDVVPEGTGWNTPPFELTLKDGVYYGRGLQDDKAPLLLCLHALNELKNSGKKLNKKFRLFVGCDEECNWEDVAYFEKLGNKFPKFGFSPDGDFPASYAEKGVVVVEFKLPKLKKFYDLKGGTVINAVCDLASCKALKDGIDLDLIKKHNLTLSEDNVITSHGISAHGSAPHKGSNALEPLFNYFLDMGEDVEDIINYVLQDGVGIKKMQNEQGFLTMSADLIREEGDSIIISCDCRIPAPFTTLDLVEKLKLTNLDFTYSEKHPTLLVDKNGALVNSLMSAYRDVTGDNTPPLSMGGSTFARVFEFGCSFGPTFVDANTGIHEANERLPEKDIKTLFEIYKKAIFLLNE